MFAERLQYISLRGASFGAAQAHQWAWDLLARTHRTLCAMRGHDLFFHFEPRRLSLRCIDCGWESSGWTIDRPRFASGMNDRLVRSGVSAHAEPAPPRSVAPNCCYRNASL
jgi:hypothetical protein